MIWMLRRYALTTVALTLALSPAGRGDLLFGWISINQPFLRKCMGIPERLLAIE